MSGLGISTQDITDAVAPQNIQAAAGAIGTENSNGQLNYKLNVQGRLKTTEEFENIVIRRDSDGSTVCLKDVARVEIGADTYAGRSRYNGQDTIALSIYRSSEANALATVEAIKKVVAQWAERQPGISSELAYDPTEYIKVSLREIIITLVTALTLVVLITWVFLQDWRATLIPSIAIPVALVGTFSFMQALGYSINTLTMFGLILVVGSLCDDAIVVVENCQSLMTHEGLSPKEAALKCMGQITGAVIATTLRYRAVLMTAWSFLFGVFPLVIATGAGSGSRRAIGITTFSGMLSATLIGIIFTPALYAVCQRLREWGKMKISRRKKPSL